MIKINPYSTNSYTKQNFKSDKKSDVQNTNFSNKTKRFGFIDTAMLGGLTGFGSYLGFALTNKKIESLKKELVPYLNGSENEKIESLKKELAPYLNGSENQKTEVVNLRNLIMETLLPDFIYKEREGIPADIPNCIMITGGDEKYQKEVIQWIAYKSPCRHVTITTNDDILACLKHQGETFKKPGTDHTLMHIIGMDKLINPKYTEFSDIEAMKDIMSSTLEDYNTTLIFSAQHPEELDSIALQPHRVRSVELNVPRDDFFFIEEARLKKINAIVKESKKISMKKNIIVGALVGLLIGVGSVIIKNTLFKNKK